MRRRFYRPAILPASAPAPPPRNRPLSDRIRDALAPPQPVMQPAPAPSAPAPDSAGRALILVVEQDPQMRRLERYFLEQAGFTVEFAADGNQGLDTARRLLPDI